MYIENPAENLQSAIEAYKDVVAVQNETFSIQKEDNESEEKCESDSSNFEIEDIDAQEIDSNDDSKEIEEDQVPISKSKRKRERQKKARERKEKELEETIKAISGKTVNEGTKPPLKEARIKVKVKNHTETDKQNLNLRKQNKQTNTQKIAFKNIELKTTRLKPTKAQITADDYESGESSGMSLLKQSEHSKTRSINKTLSDSD